MTPTALIERSESSSVGGALRSNGGSDVPTPGTNQRLDPQLRLDDEQFRRTIKHLAEQSTADDDPERNWPVALRLLTAWLQGLNFAQVSTVAGIPREQLRRVLHGELALKKSRHERIGRLVEVTRRLRALLSEDAIGEWFTTPIPALKDQTPLETLRKHRVGAVEQIVESYFDPSYA